VLALEVAVTAVGALGTVAGAVLLDAAEARLVPLALVAVTEKVYAVPAVKPEVMVQVVAAGSVAVHVPPEGLEATV
jgi:hypothetical protein